MPARSLPHLRPSLALVLLLTTGSPLAAQIDAPATVPTPDPVVVASGLELHPIIADGPLRVLRVDPDGLPVPVDVTAGVEQAERLIYSNTMGFSAFAPGTNVRIADDIVVTAGYGCKLTRYSFDVAGNINGATGPYTVSYALMNICPGAVDPSVIINRTYPPPYSGSVLVPDEQPTTIEIVNPTPDGMTIPTNLWLSLIFSRNNAGPIVGAPAQEGFSMDLYHHTGSAPCAVNFGNFPAALHGSFNARLWAGTPDEACPAANLAYHAHRGTGPLYNPGTNVSTIDDLRLLPAGCDLIGYEVTVKGAGAYNFEFRESCEGPAIAGTEKMQFVAAGSLSETERRNVRFTVDPPVPIPADVFFAARMNNSTAKLVTAGIGPGIGETEDQFGLLIPPATTCQSTDALPGHQDALNVTVICAGAAETGACCDMYVPQCVGGARDGLPCRENIHCPTPGTCEVECRELPQANCTFPPRGTFLEPGWEAGDVCEPNPFPDTICGRSACCLVDEYAFDTCLNLTKNECFAQDPPGQWQQGRLCGLAGQACPIIDCATTGSCFSARPTPSCDDNDCCFEVCTIDSYCCVVEWDPVCVAIALQHCDPPSPPSACDDAISPSGFPETLQSNNSGATLDDPSNPNVCCHNGLPLTCLGGENDGLGTTCAADDDCPGGTCGPRPPRALYPLWYKWVQPPGQTTMRVETCPSSAPASDGIIQAFAPRDTSSPHAACDSLVPIGCADDNCGQNGKQGRMCLTNLVPGNTYYAIVGAKTAEARGDYRVNFTPGCVPPAGTLPNDWCHAATTITDGATPFNLTQATLDCPAHECLAGSTKDVWFEYFPTCTGLIRFETCAGNPDTGLAIYEGCESCPDDQAQPLACNNFNSSMCGPGSPAAAATAFALRGECYKVRLSNDAGNSPLGQLRISNLSDPSPGQVSFLDPPAAVVDAGRPHPPGSPEPVGIQEIRVLGIPGMDCPLYWRVDCETAHSDGEPNEIESVAETPPGSNIYTVRLLKPITPNAFTSVRYLGNPVSDPSSVSRMTAHPGNVNGDEIADANDILAWVAAANVDAPGPPPPWGRYSLDIDRNRMLSPLDLLELIDLMNGTELYEPQLNTPLPQPTPCLPN